MVYRKKKTYTRRKNNLKKTVKSMIQDNQETMFRSATYSDDSITDAARSPIDTLLNAVAQGDTQNGRAGNQIVLTGFYGKFMLKVYDATNIIRVIMYIPRNQNVLMSTANNIGITTLVDLDQFTILHDKMYPLSTYNPQKYFVLSKKFNKGARKGITATYSGSGVDAVVKNSIYLYMVSDSGAVNDPTVSGNFRLFYKDG